MERHATPTESKRMLRRQLRAARDALAPSDRAVRSARICAGLRDLVAAMAGHELTIATYCAIQSELDSAPLRHMSLPDKTIRWAFPLLDRRDIHFHVGEPTEPGPWQLLQPHPDSPRLGASDLNLVIVPGLGFDRRGHRLGYGAGYYDRALARLSSSTRFIGVCFREQLIPMIPDSDGDIPMHAIVSDDEDGDVIVHQIGALP